MNIEEAAAFYYFNKLPCEYLPEIAVNALVNGIESDSLYLLASETNITMSNLGPLFEKCLIELNLENATKEEQSIISSKYYAKELLAEKIDAEQFGFKVGSLLKFFEVRDGLKVKYESAPKNLIEIYNHALWHDECATEYGYPKDWKAFRVECVENIINLATKLVNAD